MSGQQRLGCWSPLTPPLSQATDGPALGSWTRQQSAQACLPLPQHWRWGDTAKSGAHPRWKLHLERAPRAGGNTTQCFATMRRTSKQFSALPKVLQHPLTAHQKKGLGELGTGEDPEQLPERTVWPRKVPVIIQHLPHSRNRTIQLGIQW